MFIIAIWNIKGRFSTSLLTIAALTFSIAIMIFMVGIQWGLYGTLERSYTQFFVGQYQILKTDFDLNDLNASYFNEDWIDPKLLDQFQDEGFFFSKRLYADVLLIGNRNGQENYVLRLAGVNGSQENKVAGYYRSAGTDFSENLLISNEIFIGKTLADNLGLIRGQSYSFLIERKDGSIIVENFVIKDLLISGQEDLEKNLAYIDLRYLRRISSRENELHSITLYSKKNNEGGGLIEDIKNNRSLPPQLQIVSWDYFRPDLKQFIDFDISLGWFYYVVMILIIGVSIFNFYSIQIYHRYHEVSICLALGLSKEEIFFLMAVEILMIFIVGIILGSMTGVGGLWIYRNGFLIPGAEEIAQYLGASPYVIPKIFSMLHLIVPVSIFFFPIFAMVHFLIKLYRSDTVRL